MNLGTTLRIQAAGEKKGTLLFSCPSGEVIDLPTLLQLYQNDVALGYPIDDRHGVMQGKGPKGGEWTTKALKKHKSISNPWALSNWMRDKGYHLHEKKPKGES